MITIIFKVTTKESKSNEFYEVTKSLVAASVQEPGCITYVFHQSVEDKNQFMLYEQWENEDALNTHIEVMIKKYGRPHEGDFFPAKLSDYIKDKSAEFYKVIK